MNIGLHKVSEGPGQTASVTPYAPSVGEVDVDMGRLGIRCIVIVLLGFFNDFLMKGLLLHRQDSMIAAGGAQNFGEFNYQRWNFMIEPEVRLFARNFAAWYRDACFTGGTEHVSLNLLLFGFGRH